MQRIKSESSSPRLQTPGRGGSTRGRGSGGGGGGHHDNNNNNESNGNANSGGIHPALMKEILRCEDVDLDMLKHAAYKIMKRQPRIHRTDLRAQLSAEESEFAAMLSGERWEGQDYPEERIFETDLDMLLIKIMSIARLKLKGEARGKNKRAKQSHEDEGYATTSTCASAMPADNGGFRRRGALACRIQTMQGDSSVNSRDQGEDYTMPGGLGDNDDAFGLCRSPEPVRTSVEEDDRQEEHLTMSGGLRNCSNVIGARDGEFQSPPLNDFIRHATSLVPPRQREQEADCTSGTPARSRAGRHRRRIRGVRTVIRQRTENFSEQDVIELD